MTVKNKISVLLALVISIGFTYNLFHLNKIIKQTTGKNGLTSITFIQERDTVSLYYLTSNQIDSIKEELNF